MKIVILDGNAVNPGDLSWQPLAQLGDITVYDHSDPSEVIPHIGDAEIVLTNKSIVSEEVFKACPAIRLVCVLATGYNVVDCEAAAKRRIPVCNVPGYSTASVAQFTFALLLEICHQVGLHNQHVHAGKWSECPNFCYWATPQMELAGKTLGIIGLGSIGRAVAKIASAMGMKVLAHSRTEYPAGKELAQYVDLDTLLHNSDIISLHCPLFPETSGLINQYTIRKMKDGVILLNTARGGLLDEAAVASALQKGKIRYAAVDVVSSEPITADNPLLSAPNCIITSHMAWAPVETRQRIIDMAVANINAFVKGEPINVVNM